MMKEVTLKLVIESTEQEEALLNLFEGFCSVMDIDMPSFDFTLEVKHASRF